MPVEWMPYVPVAALVISLIALFVSGANLGWSIYKELALRARIRIQVRFSVIDHQSFAKPLHRVVVSVTNLGPGKVRLVMLDLRRVSLWRRLTRRCLFGVLIYDYAHPLGGKLPYSLDIGEGIDYTFSPEDSFLEGSYDQVGIRDSFGRVHWCSRAAVKEARKELFEYRKKEQADHAKKS